MNWAYLLEFLQSVIVLAGLALAWALVSELLFGAYFRKVRKYREWTEYNEEICKWERFVQYSDNNGETWEELEGTRHTAEAPREYRKVFGNGPRSR